MLHLNTLTKESYVKNFILTGLLVCTQINAFAARENSELSLEKTKCTLNVQTEGMKSMQKAELKMTNMGMAGHAMFAHIKYGSVVYRAAGNISIVGAGELAISGLQLTSENLVNGSITSVLGSVVMTQNLRSGTVGSSVQDTIKKSTTILSVTCTVAQ